jgi:multidrug efflux pump subunit AcrA (membrane-fusion protein)
MELIPGQFVRIQSPVGEPVPRLLVEERAISSDLRGEHVLVVNGQNVVEYRPVKLGIAVGGMRVIEDGLKETDWVIINGLQRARTGEKVEPERSTMAAPKKDWSLVDAPASSGK